MHACTRGPPTLLAISLLRVLHYRLQYGNGQTYRIGVVLQLADVKPVPGLNIHPQRDLEKERCKIRVSPERWFDNHSLADFLERYVDYVPPIILRP